MKKSLWLFLGLLFCLGLNAQEVPADTGKAPEPELENTGNEIKVWDIVLGLGYNYRRFHSVKQFSQPAGGGHYYYGGGGGGGYVPIGTNQQEVPEEPEKVYVGNSDFGMTECFGYELDFLVPFYRHDRLRLAAALGFQYYELDTKYSSANYNSSFDFQMHTYDVGVKASYALFDSLDLVATLGPSFNFIDMKTRSFRDNEDTKRLDMGVFGALGLQYWIRPWIGVCAQLRYDKVFSDAATRYAEMNLDTWNTDVRLVFLF